MILLRKFIYMVALLTAQPCFSQTWLPVGTGLTCGQGNYVIDINLKENNQGLLVAGIIGSAGVLDGVCEMQAVLLWDGQQYSEAAEQQSHIMSTLAFDFQGKTYGSGYFTGISANNRFHVANEDGLWDSVPSGIKGTSRDYFIHDDVAYICGAYRQCGGQPCALVCSFDGEQVVPLYHHPSLESYYAYSVTVYQDTLFVSGNFGAESLALEEEGLGWCSKIVDGEMLKVGQGFSYPSAARSLQEMDGKLYMAGSLTPLGSSQSYSMMYYENGQVYTLQSYPNEVIFTMKYYNGGLYVAGDFTFIGNMPCKGVARYDGQEWTCLCNQTVYDHQGNVSVLPFSDLEIWNDTLYVGGRFDRIGNTTLKRIAKLDMALSEEFPVNITEQQRQELKLNVYPNPANDKINIQLSSPADVFIYTATGQLLETYSSKSTYQIDVSDYPTGLYLAVSGGVMKRFVRE